MAGRSTRHFSGKFPGTHKTCRWRTSKESKSFAARGGAIWGANAVNGVINIITKKAGDSLGTMLVGGGGTQEQEFGTVQYGGSIKDHTSCTCRGWTGLLWS